MYYFYFILILALVFAPCPLLFSLPFTLLIFYKGVSGFHCRRIRLNNLRLVAELLRQSRTQGLKRDRVTHGRKRADERRVEKRFANFVQSNLRGRHANK